MESHFTWVSWIFGHALDQTVTSTLVMLAIVAWAIVALRQVQAVRDPVVPDANLSARTLAEMFVEWFQDFAGGVLGDKARRYVPIYGTFFLFILCANLSGLIPGFSPPTSNFNIAFALGVTSFVLYNFFAFQQKGVGYLKHFLGPLWWLIPLMLPLELIDNFVRPASLALRLFGNMTGDHVVIGIFTDLTKVVIPVIFLCLGSFVSLVQAFVFSILSMVYLSLALADHDHDHDHEHGHGHAEGHAH